MNRFAIVSAISAAALGCTTGATISSLPPDVIKPTTFSVEEIRSCAYRWYEVGAFNLEYRPDGLLVKDIYNSAYALLSVVDGVVEVRTHFGATGMRGRLREVGERCAADASANPPAGWGFSPLLKVK